MTTIKYNYLIATLIIIFSFFFHNTAEAQVSNDDRFHYELYIGFVQPLINEDLVNTDEWVAKFNFQTDINNSASTLGSIDACGPIFRVDPGETAIGPDTNDDGIIDGRANVITPPIFDQNENDAGKKAIDINMRVFEEDTRGTGPGCSGGDINHDDTAIALLTIDESSVDNFSGGQNFAGAVPLNTSGANTAVAYAWRYARGEANNPLSFGAIDYNTTVSHLNSNRIKPVLSPSSTALGIHNPQLNYPNLDGPPSRDAGEVYYTFSIDATSKVTISTNNATTTATTFLILRRLDGSLRASGTQEMVDLILDAGTYTIQVDGVNGGGLFDLTVLRKLENPPTNRFCTSPKALTCDTLLEDEDNTAVGNDNNGNCNNGTLNNALWYSFVGDGSTIRLDIELPSFFPRINLYTNNDTDNCNDLVCGASGSQSLVYKTLVGVNYWVAVYGDDANDFGTFDLRVRCFNGDINDRCNDAAMITCGATISDSTTFSRVIDAPNCFSPSQQSIGFRGNYYNFIGDGSIIDITVESDVLLVLFLYSGVCNNLTCEDEDIINSKIEDFQTTVGVQYTILVAGQNQTFVEYDLTLTGTSCDTNDNCSGALTLSIGDGECNVPVNATNVGATDSGVAHDCAGYEGGDVWFKFVAPASGNVTVETSDDGSGNFDSGMAVYDGCGASASQLGCIDDGAGLTGSFSKLVLSNLIGGQTYYVGVWWFRNSFARPFNICAYDHTSSDPCTDGYTGDRALVGDQTVPREYSTDQSIESSQIIGSPSNTITVRYFPGRIGQSVILNENFEVKPNTLFEIWLEGCL